ncbi:preprotein translocase subunit SecG [Adhaeretor mobilis]|uniref:Protein-export membrane protein SecG n=2 Tax=Adhaeretor mobilis TaxID=1930276 RepID=A0A517MVJ9_9BACT|nr:preprotein translocase subunit SecG [Adhaeretor mobilis]
MKPVYGLLLSVTAIFMILLVLVQRGRGGGLAGALGGAGGSSAFGAKAGDVFTRITIGAAAFWIVLCIAAAKWGGEGESLVGDFGAKSAAESPAQPGLSATEDDEEAEAPAETEAGDGEGGSDTEPDTDASDSE